MSELDKKLDKIVQELGVTEPYTWDSESDPAEYTAIIKQAFRDAGYYQSSMPQEEAQLLAHHYGYMSGQEWYERFEKELTDKFHKRSAIQVFNVLAIAKKAAGITE